MFYSDGTGRNEVTRQYDNEPQRHPLSLLLIKYISIGTSQLTALFLYRPILPPNSCLCIQLCPQPTPTRRRSHEGSPPPLSIVVNQTIASP